MGIVSLTIRYSVYKKVIGKTSIVTMPVELNPVNDVHECIVVNAYWIVASDNSVILYDKFLSHHTFNGVIPDQ